MSRKRFKSDKITTVLRVSKVRAKIVRTAAKNAKENLFVTTEKILARGMQQSTMDKIEESNQI